MSAVERLPVIAVTGMAFEARIAAGPGVVTVCAPRADALAQALAAAIAKGCRGLVSFGVAGGLAPHVSPGDCIVARSIVTPQQRFDTHLEWSSQLLQSIGGAMHADMAGSLRLISSPADKIALGRTTGALAVDMESVVVARFAADCGVPFAVVRVVADACHRELPPAARIDLRPDGTPDLRAVLNSVIGRPQQIGGLIRVALDTRAARAALLRARREMGPGFGLAEAAESVATSQPAIERAE